MASFTRRGERWRVQVRRTGHKPLASTHRTRREAEEWARNIEAKIDAGTLVAPSRRLTVADLIRAYRDLREAGRPVVDTSNEHYMLRHLEAGLGDVLLHALTAQHLVAYCRDRKHQGAGPYTCLMEVSKLGTVLRYAGAGLGLPDVVGQARPLLNHAGLIGGGGKRERRPSEDELERILAALPRKYVAPVQLMLAIGLRRGEVCRLLWDDVDWDKGLILVRDRKDPRQKIGNDQWVPLIRGAREIVSREIGAGGPPPGGPVFRLQAQTLSKVFKLVCDQLGVVDLHLHDLRHEAISQMFEAGLTIEQVALVSGHKDWKHLRRYTNLKPESVHSLPAAADPGTRPRPADRPSAGRRRGRS